MNDHSVLNPTSINGVRECVKISFSSFSVTLEPCPFLIDLRLLLNAQVAHTFTFKF